MREVSKKRVVGRPIKKGEVRNPRGRVPNQKSISELLRELGKEHIKYRHYRWKGDDTGEMRSMSRLRSMCINVYEAARRGDMQAVNFIADRTEGKVTQQIRQQIEDYRITIDDNA